MAVQEVSTGTFELLLVHLITGLDSNQLNFEGKMSRSQFLRSGCQ